MENRLNSFDENDNPHGLWLTCGDSGNVWSEESYDHGRIHGKWRAFTKTGELKDSWWFENNLQEGEEIELVYYE